MKIQIDIPEYCPEQGLRLKWQADFVIEVRVSDDTVLIKGNSPGLVSLAYHLLALAQSEVPAGHHLHYDDMNSLEDGSCELIVEKA